MPELLTNKTIEKLKYDLVRENIVSYDDLFEAENFAKTHKQNLGASLVALGFIDEAKILKFIEKKLHIPFVDLNDYQIDIKSFSFINYENAKKYNIIPMFIIENVLTVAMSDPLNLFVVHNILKSNNIEDIEVEAVLSSETLIKEAIKKHYSTENIEKITEEEKSWQDELLNENINKDFDKIISKILTQAIDENQEYIFFQNSKKGMDVLFSNELKGYIPRLLTPMLLSEIKLAANLDVNISDIPQLGRKELNYKNKLYSFIISTYPSINGERVSISIFEPPKPLKEYNFSQKEMNLINETLNKTGVIQVRGAQNSGKTLFIYSLLSSLENKNIITLESKIKYKLQGVTQCELNKEVGFNLKTALDFLTFQNPDVVYIENILSLEDMELVERLSNLKTIIVESNIEMNNINLSVILKNFNAKLEVH